MESSTIGKTHKNLTDTSRKFHQSNAETVRNAIDAYLSNKNVKNPSAEGQN